MGGTDEREGAGRRPPELVGRAPIGSGAGHDARYDRGMSHSRTAVTAVVLAGGEDGDRLAREAGVEAKALVPLGDRPMGAYVLEALRACPAVGRIVYVGPVNVRLRGLYDATVPAGSRLVDSLALGLGAGLAQGARGRLLVLTADIPWVTGDVLSRFIAQAPAAELVYPAVRRRAAEEQFPHQSRTYVRLREGALTGGNAVLLEASAVGPLLPWIDRAFRARKNPIALAGIVGPGVLLAFLVRRASIDMLERRVSRLVGITARAHLSDDASLAADVDRPAHVPGALTAGRPGVRA